MQIQSENSNSETLPVVHKIDLSGDKIGWKQKGKIFTATVKGRTLVRDDGDVWSLSCDVPVTEEV